MSTAPTSQTSTPCESNQATQTTNSDPTGGHEHSWVWSFFAESHEGAAQFQKTQIFQMGPRRYWINLSNIGHEKGLKCCNPQNSAHILLVIVTYLYQ
ncbi:hypothetical protein O181_014587 [Austropuccinia psidii MF-1]|uniref:Uncharacterized protein n=1 Tax=Austropuccinia psidii MF-1 TaxID=1389203 RepID=A0A9Q3C1X6_9BASI|nr:hypothetical protein [Austropuccinia psidii MF-1]